MTTSYPGGLDAFTNPTSGDDLNTVGVVHSVQHANLNDALEAVQGELGTNPSAGFATVGARFAAVEADAALALERVFHVDDFGAVGDGSTDDTTAIRAAITAAASAGGGTVQFGPKTYLVNGPLVTTEYGYAILPIPMGRAPIRFRGVSPTNNCDVTADTGKYSIVKTTKTGLTRSGTYGVPSVIGGPTDGGSHWVESMVCVENLAFWLPANPTMAGVDLRYVRRMLWDGAGITALNVGDTDFTEPTSVYAFGLRTPDPLNYNAVLIRNGGAGGMYVGLASSVESLTVEYWSAKWCKIGWAPGTGGHGALVGKMDLSWCPYSISGWSETVGVTSVPTGTLGETAAQMNVQYLALEDYAGTSKWYDPVENINDSTNRFKGVVFYDHYLYLTGIDSTLNVNGATGLEAVSILSPSFGGGTPYTLTVQDENSNVSTAVTQIDFQGAGVTTTTGTGEVVVTIAGGSTSTGGQLIMQDGVTAPPVPLETEARDDWLYQD